MSGVVIVSGNSEEVILKVSLDSLRLDSEGVATVRFPTTLPLPPATPPLTSDAQPPKNKKTHASNLDSRPLVEYLSNQRPQFKEALGHFFGKPWADITVGDFREAFDRDGPPNPEIFGTMRPANLAESLFRMRGIARNTIADLVCDLFSAGILTFDESKRFFKENTAKDQRALHQLQIIHDRKT